MTIIGKKKIGFDVYKKIYKKLLKEEEEEFSVCPCVLDP